MTTAIDLEEQYDHDSREVYRRTIREHMTPGGEQADRLAYIPDPDELKQRCHDARWLTACGFSNEFIGSVLGLDCPTVEVVERMVLRYGVPETERRLTPMLDEWRG